MGCTCSREARRGRRRNFVKSLSVPPARQPQRKGDSFDMAGLSHSRHSFRSEDNFELLSDEEMKMITNDQKRNVSIEIRLSKSPARSRPHELEPEIINAWELMDGLEDTTPLRLSFASNTFRLSGRSSPEPPLAKSKLPNMSPTSSPVRMQSTAEDNSEFNIDATSKLEKTMKELSLEATSIENHESPNFAGIVKARVSAFQEKIDAKKASFKAMSAAARVEKCSPAGKGKLVLYFTSLRILRKTFEDCWNTKVIIQGYGFRIDERDLSLHGGFKDELHEILGPGHIGSMLPRVFANGKYLGGAEEVIRMHEAGELVQALRDCEVVPVENWRSPVTCEGCGDVRFVLCGNCSGSCKVFMEEDYEGEEKVIGGFRRCPDCNENGLVRCPFCCCWSSEAN